MSLKSQFQDDLKVAMKAGDVFSLGVLRMLIAAAHNKEIEKRGKGLPEELTEDETLAVARAELKKRQDAMVLYEQGGRADLADQERKEAAFIQHYLPRMMSRAEIEKAVSRILSQSDFTDFGAAMKAVMAELKTVADARVISEIIQRKF